MKKTYEAPSIEKIAFQYRDQVVAASGGGHTCVIHWNQQANTNECSSVVEKTSESPN